MQVKSDALDKELEKILRQGKLVPNLHDGLIYSLGLDIKSRDRRGKRLRPTLCLVTCEALGGNMRHAMTFACICEILHTYFLIHDDIEDGDKFRRNRPAVWVKYGLSHGINIGDFMLAVMLQTI